VPIAKGFSQREWAQASPSSFFSLYFSLLPGNLKTETGSIVTASATNQSPHGGDFPGAAPNTHVLAPSRPVDFGAAWMLAAVLHTIAHRQLSFLEE
jgi:hypothetical protein